MGINVTTSKQQITANVAEDKVTATVSAGFGATGPSGVINVTAPITNAGTTTAANIGLSVGTGLSVSGGAIVLGSHTHDDRYYTETEINTLLTGYATLVGGKVPSEQLPSYVDDVLEYANVASLPNTGETGKIYVALNTGKIYRWSGSAYFEISTPPDNTDAVPEGSTNLYFTNARARNAFGTGTTGQVITWSGGQWTAGSVTVAAGDITSGTLASARLPIATANAIGAVRIGSGISIDGNGVISASSGYTLPTATASVLGGVKIGSGVTITDGVISVSTNYAASSHTHGISDVTGLQTALDGKQASGSYAAAVHTHGISDVTGLQTALDGKASLSHAHSAADITSGVFDVARIPQFDVRTDTVSSTAYTGRAVSGSATSASVWKIRRTVYSSAGAVSSTATATNVKWDDRLTASYA